MTLHQTNRRKLTRLKNYDYSQNGYYFLTISSYKKQKLFGELKDKEIKLNELGIIAKIYWKEINFHYPDVILDEFVIMPDHIHGILLINKSVEDVGAQNFEPLPKQNQYQKIIPRSIGSIVRGYKSSVTKWARINNNIDKIWQRNFYEHIIRSEESLNKIRNYISNNTLALKLKFNENYEVI